MDDLISKQAAMDALERINNYCEEIDNHLPKDEKSGYKMFPDYMTVWKYLHQLPSAERHGRWRNYEGMLTCSVCGMEFYNDIMDYTGDEVPRYCPNCGASMDEVEE